MSLVCQETGKSWRVHGIVMLAMTEDMLRHKTEQQEAPLTLPWSENTIEALIKTAYEGAEKVQLDVGQEDVLKDLVSAAGSLNVNALKDKPSIHIFHLDGLESKPRHGEAWRHSPHVPDEAEKLHVATLRPLIYIYV